MVRIMDIFEIQKNLLARYAAENKTAQKGQVVCAGSSLMEQFPINKFAVEAGCTVPIYNRGIGGYVCDQLIDAIDTCILELEPSKLFINIGTNDLSNPDLTIDDVMEKYDTILNIVEDKLENVKIYMMAYYPINIDAAADYMIDVLTIRNNEKICKANEAVRLLAEKHGAQYIDINGNLKDSQGRLKAEYTVEGMHINESGYRAIWDDFMKYVME